MHQESPETYNIRTRIGRLRFDIYLDDSFRATTAPRFFNQHNHSNFEVHFIVEGCGRLLLEQEEIELQSGHFYVIPPGVYHSIVLDRQRLLSKYTIRFDWVEEHDYDDSFPASEEVSLKSALSQIGFFYAPDTGSNELLDRINREIEQPALGYYSNLQSYFNQIMIQLLRAGAPTIRSGYQLPRRVPDDSRSLVIDAFFDRYESELTLEELATELHLSARQTSRILKQMYNTTFQQKLHDTRVEEGKKRLRTTDHTITAISDQLGFASPALFCSIFKKKIGQSPQAYRKASNKSSK
ncbi:helix-turn-helix transcriptional regulator [Paenibacillus koleovorans]|uniref:helix-turn-helix transcriptional regulator n=1 Tax=Paenibacillus koleovorans TaxID=121608 RepID=UPI0013E39564|nr:helix-turn-helix transcriptional regulator [Paenibacillus koleovorans]